jgi:hypothetical protein
MRHGSLKGPAQSKRLLTQQIVFQHVLGVLSLGKSMIMYSLEKASVFVQSIFDMSQSGSWLGSACAQAVPTPEIQRVACALWNYL